jgi:hypothetical protein
MSGVFSIAAHSVLQYLPDVITHEQTGCAHLWGFSVVISLLPASHRGCLDSYRFGAPSSIGKNDSDPPVCTGSEQPSPAQPAGFCAGLWRRPADRFPSFSTSIEKTRRVPEAGGDALTPQLWQMFSLSVGLAPNTNNPVHSLLVFGPDFGTGSSPRSHLSLACSQEKSASTRRTITAVGMSSDSCWELVLMPETKKCVTRQDSMPGSRAN